jgi:DNA invertase Pin-like site-specific DNA recombinase
LGQTLIFGTTAATLVIAKLDWLSRNAAFLLTLRHSGVRFVAVEMPGANDRTVGIMAPVARQEREAISRRTREALAACGARGAPGQPQRRRGAQAGRQGRCAAQGGGARDVVLVVADIRSAGHTSLGAIANELNTRGMLTRRGGQWHKSTDEPSRPDRAKP